jgi:DNA mismatch repair protein MutL
VERSAERPPPYRPEGAPALPFPAGTAAAAPESLGAASRPVAGQLFDTYLVTLLPDALVLTDQHAAHERILYERILARAAGGASQLLLEPMILDVGPAEAGALEQVRAELAGIGLEIEPSGPRSWRIRSLPPELPPAEAEAFVRDLLATGREGAAPPGVPPFRHRAAALLACHGAVRALRRLAPAEAASLLADLARTGNPGSCPHGRPTAISIDRAEIERRFKRT